MRQFCSRRLPHLFSWLRAALQTEKTWREKLAVIKIVWYCDSTVQEEERLLQELEQDARDWPRLMYTKLQRHLEQQPKKIKTAFNIDHGKVGSGVAEGLSWLRFMMYRRHAKRARCRVYVGAEEAIMAQSEKIMTELIQRVNHRVRLIILGA